MSTILSKDKIVLKVFNNNIVLVNSGESEKILFAKGIGFGKKPSQIISAGTSIDKVFVIENEQNIRDLKNLVNTIDAEFFAACEEAIYEISRMVDTELNERIHIGLIDHLFFAVKRLKNNEQIENPFLIETQTLYPKEYNLAELVSRMIENHSNISIPDGEIGFITLHIHSALNDGKISNTIKNTNLLNDIVKYAEEELGYSISKNSLDYARFCTHVKFAIQRIMTDNTVNNDLASIIKKTYPKSYAISEGIAKIIEGDIDIAVSEDEIACLTIHIERFRLK
ncbi:glucose PTS transporter transcription antiterminator GlcT [uncultured Clostridium sp.]|uniref:glucose PTS transporter transcription antiterminator GlcT n=1 Tax=uncultured Clostridium sp. TaxID=59620 RepID=UPI0025D0AB25|nr:PRD domain-containing protein [uncultured Clostridium sp.]